MGEDAGDGPAPEPLIQADLGPPGSGPGTKAANDTGTLQTAALRGSWWTALQAMVSLPISFLVNIVVARALGPAEYGVMATYMVAFGVLVTVLNAGISDATIQWGAAAYARGDRAELIGVVRRCAGYHLYVEAPLVAVTTVVLLRHESLTTQLIGAAATTLTMAVGTTVVALTAMSFSSALARLAFGIGLVVNLAVVTTAVQSHAAGPTWVARLVVPAAGPLIALFLAPADIRWAALRPLAPRQWPAGFLRFSWRTMLVSLVTTLVFSRSELFVLDAAGDVAAAGVFALAAGLAGQITAPVDAIAGPLVPAAASLLAVDRIRAGRAVLRGVRLAGVLTALVVAVVLPLVVVLLPAVYGAGFAVAAGPLLVLGLVSCLQSVLHPVGAFLTACRRPLTVLAVNAVALAVDLGVTIALVPPLGVTGAVVGNGLGQLLSIGGAVWLLHRLMGLPLRPFLATLVPFGLAAGCGVIASVLGLWLVHDGASPWAIAPLAAAVGAVAAAVGIRMVGGAVGIDETAPFGVAFPRLAGPVVRTLGRLGWLRSESPERAGRP